MNTKFRERGVLHHQKEDEIVDINKIAQGCDDNGGGEDVLFRGHGAVCSTADETELERPHDSDRRMPEVWSTLVDAAHPPALLALATHPELRCCDAHDWVTIFGAWISYEQFTMPRRESISHFSSSAGMPSIFMVSLDLQAMSTLWWFSMTPHFGGNC